MPGSPVHFGHFMLLAGERRLTQDGRDVSLGPRAMEVLVALVERAGKLVSKDELLSIVWPRLVVEEANLHVQVSQLRKVIGAEAIVTVPGLGYRFAATLADGAVAAEPTLRRLSLIVLPFVESGARPEEEYFADAITDGITTQLSKIKGSYVIGSPTAFAYKRERFDVAAVARELGVRYVLQGRIERSEEGVETNVRLSDAATGAVIWSDVIAVAQEGVINIRREVVARLAMALGLQLVVAEGRRSAVDAHPTAIDLVMQAQAAGLACWLREAYEASLRLYDRALEVQPDLGVALSGRAAILIGLTRGWPGPDTEVHIARAERDVVRAIAQDPADVVALRTLSGVRQMQFRLPAAIAAIEQALEMTANNAHLLWWRGFLAILDGEPESSFAHLHRVLALSPRDPYRWLCLFWLGTANLHLGRYEEAVVWLEKSAALLPFWGTLRFLTAAYAHVGQLEQAHAAWRQMLLDPAHVHVKRVRFSNHPLLLQQHREHLLGGLLKAGIAGATEEFDEWAARQRPDAL